MFYSLKKFQAEYVHKNTGEKITPVCMANSEDEAKKALEVAYSRNYDLLSCIKVNTIVFIPVHPYCPN
jgi:hypothetical protein